MEFLSVSGPRNAAAEDEDRAAESRSAFLRASEAARRSKFIDSAHESLKTHFSFPTIPYSSPAELRDSLNDVIADVFIRQVQGQVNEQKALVTD